MHVVTKILLVFGAILSVLLASLTIAYSANADTLRDAVANEIRLRKVAEGELAAERTLVQDEKRTLVSAKEAADRKVADLERQITDLEQERSRLQSETVRARFDDQAEKNRLDNLTATASANAEMIKALNDELAALRQSQVQSARRETELIDRLNDLESQRQVLQQSTRALQEQLAEARLQLEQARTGGPGTGTANQPFVATGPLVQARVQEVRATPAGEELAVISEGASAGLRPNQKLSIIRGGQFIASLVIVSVDVQQAVGRVDKLGRTVTVQADDLVLSRLE